MRSKKEQKPPTAQVEKVSRGSTEATGASAEAEAHQAELHQKPDSVSSANATEQQQQQQQQPMPPQRDKQQSKANANSKALPVLPWMRVPISIEGGAGVPLSQVIGLHPRACAALQACKQPH